jgi:hypothetical protein
MEKISWTDHVRNEHKSHRVKEYPTNNTYEKGYIGTAFQNTLLKKQWLVKIEVTEDEEKEVGSYWITIQK